MAEKENRVIAPQRTFERKEEKFLMPAERYGIFWSMMDGYLEADEYGETTIMSVYYDNDEFDLLGRSADSPRYKEKFRVRSYGIPDDSSTVFAEIKKKYSGIVYKRRVEGSFREIEDMLQGKIRLEHHGQIQDEIMWMMKRYSLKPAVLIACERTAYTAPSDPGLRVTVDSGIRYRLDDLDMRNGSGGIPLREEGFRLMEVKTSGGMPRRLTEALSASGIYAGSFSKVGTCYKEVIVPSLREGTDSIRGKRENA